MFDQIKRNSEEGFALASVLEFFHLWRSKKKASLLIECKDGEASINFKCNLGYPDQQHVKSKVKKRKSVNRTTRDNARAAAYQAGRGSPLTASPPPSAAPSVPQGESSCRSSAVPPTTPKRTATSPLESSPKRVELPVWDPDISSPGVLRGSVSDESLGDHWLKLNNIWSELFLFRYKLSIQFKIFINYWYISSFLYELDVQVLVVSGSLPLSVLLQVGLTGLKMASLLKFSLSFIPTQLQIN